MLIKNKCMVTKGETFERGINHELGINTHTRMYIGWITNKIYCIAQETLPNICDNLDEKKI